MKQQQTIIATLGVKPTINPESAVRTSINFLKSYIQKYHFIRTLVLGLSGGQDSTLTGKISQMAISELRQDTGVNNYQCIIVRMPYGKQKDESDCQDAIAFINPDRVFNINIKHSIQVSKRLLHKAGIVLNDHVNGNVKARERMQILYSISGMTSGIVVGTSNAAEVVTGFFTKNGDGATDINPLFSFNKRQCQALLKYLDCPNHLYSKIPIADLEEEQPAMPDESIIGVTYNTIDDYLEGKSIDLDAANIIEDLYKGTEHKRHLPVTLLDNYW